MSISAIRLVGWHYQWQIDHTLRERKQLWHNDPAMIYVVCQPLSTFCTKLLFLIPQIKPIKLRVERSDGKIFKLMLGFKPPTLRFPNWQEALHCLTILCVKVRSAGCQFLELDLWNDTKARAPDWSHSQWKKKQCGHQDIGDTGNIYPLCVVKVDSIVLLFGP